MALLWPGPCTERSPLSIKQPLNCCHGWRGVPPHRASMFKESSASQGKGFANVDMESCENDMPFARAVGDNKRTLEAMTYQGTIGRGARPHTQKSEGIETPVSQPVNLSCHVRQWGGGHTAGAPRCGRQQQTRPQASPEQVPVADHACGRARGLWDSITCLERL